VPVGAADAEGKRKITLYGEREEGGIPSGKLLSLPGRPAKRYVNIITSHEMLSRTNAWSRGEWLAFDCSQIPAVLNSLG
jgi:hypothetical protein